MSLNLAILISGGGRTLQNFIDLICRRELDAAIRVVVSSSAKAAGNGRARAAGLSLEVVERRRYPSAESFSEAVTQALAPHPVDLVLLAGFLHLWKFPERYRGRVMNIHPALLPRHGGRGMYGHHVHEAVLAAGEKESGCTVHFADHQYDRGPVILQRRVPVLPGDTPATLADRVFEAERSAYPEAVRLFAEGKARMT
jgi:formyltetrahydrofolate-dependent phosphoribosylglycinamide formyltransferase